MEPFGNRNVIFSPTLKHRRGLFSLLQNGLISIDEDTPLDAFSFSNGRVTGYHFSKMHWKLPPATLSLMEQLLDVGRRATWPNSWAEDALGFAESIATEEIIQYLEHLAEKRRWPAPDDEEKVKALATKMISSISVTEAFYLCYIGAMAASDYKAQHPVNAQQASNVMVLRASQRLETARANGWELKQYSRSKDVPRSEISRVFFEQFLGLEDHAFTTRTAALSYPQSNGSKNAK